MTSVPLFWQRCLDAFREELTPQQFNTWIRPLAVEGSADGYRLLAPNRFVLQWVKERFADRIAELATAVEGRAVPIALAIVDAVPAPTRAPPQAARPLTAPVSIPAPRPAESPPQCAQGATLRRCRGATTRRA